MFRPILALMMLAVVSTVQADKPRVSARASSDWRDGVELIAPITFETLEDGIVASVDVPVQTFDGCEYGDFPEPNYLFNDVGVSVNAVGGSATLVSTSGILPGKALSCAVAECASDECYTDLRFTAAKVRFVCVGHCEIVIWRTGYYSPLILESPATAGPETVTILGFNYFDFSQPIAVLYAVPFSMWGEGVMQLGLAKAD